MICAYFVLYGIGVLDVIYAIYKARLLVDTAYPVDLVALAPVPRCQSVSAYHVIYGDYHKSVSDVDYEIDVNYVYYVDYAGLRRDAPMR